MDLATLDTTKLAETGAPMQLRDPVSEAILVDTSGKPITITLAGDDSERYRNAQRKSQNRRLAMQGRRNKTISAEEIENDTLTALAAATVSWSGIVVDGNEMECTPQNAVTLYKRLPWVREQAETFIFDRSNFLPKSSTTSAPTPSTSST